MAVQALANGFQSVKDMLFDIEGSKPYNVNGNSKDNFITENQSAHNYSEDEIITETKIARSETVSDSFDHIVRLKTKIPNLNLYEY